MRPCPPQALYPGILHAQASRLTVHQELLALLREHNGDKASPVLRALLHSTLWLSADPFAWQAARLRGLAADWGRSFELELRQTPTCAPRLIGFLQ